MEPEMNVIDLFKSDCQSYWLAEIGKSDWRGGELLYELLHQGTFFDVCGPGARVLLLTQGHRLVSFCTYAAKDDIPCELTPWMGYVYTFPQYRGHRCMQLLFDEVVRLARQEQVARVHISTGHTGLYEKYGCKFLTMLPNRNGDLARIYVREISQGSPE